MLIQALLGSALRGVVLLGLALAAMPLLRGASSATRRLVLALTMGGALVLPMVSAIAPAWHVGEPAAVTSLRGIVTTEPLVSPDEATVAPASGEAAVPVAAPVDPVRSFDPAVLLVGVWALGGLLVLARLVVGVVRTRGIVRRAAPAQAWAVSAARAERATGLRVAVRMTGELDAPAVTGVLAPVVLVPRASASWSDDRRYAVLLHELAHVRQRDCLAHGIGQLACALHWFDPLAWMVARRLRLERELAADDAVVAAGARASSYAKDLLSIADASAMPRAVPGGALGMAERSQLAARLTAIVSASRSRRPLTRGRAALLVASLTAVVLVVACTSAAPVKTDVAGPSPSPVAAPAPATAGSTLDPRTQAIAEEELDRMLTEWKGAAGAILVLDPSTGEVLADAGRAHGARADVGIRSAYVTGSTMKAFTLAAALEEGVLSPTERIDCENGVWTKQGKVLHDSGQNGVLSVTEMMAVSSNVGFGKVADRLGGDRLQRWQRAFHFGVAPALDGATAGSMPERVDDADHPFAAAIAGIGEVVTASPLQVAAAYAVLANDGAYVAPTLIRRNAPAPRERLLRPETARAATAVLENALGSEKSTGTRARIAGVRVAGKTGTASWELPGGGEGVYASFVGFAPVDAPRFVIVVGVEQPREDGSGGTAAAPAFARVATRLLAR
ncbi:MAG TPA: penicillin-binding transpeptidase domain-containing protein [Polyangiaceae bacterium]|jgi:beta-lactamase regulating signal transducer with metallopeptidase domain|nr:penicillin-binding transpeptidase domain-containing protein [Polyangiaceae bacterium]